MLIVIFSFFGYLSTWFSTSSTHNNSVIDIKAAYFATLFTIENFKNLNYFT